MHNIHTHAWDETLHMQPDTIRETDLSRGYHIDLSVPLDAFLREMEPFTRVAVFGLKARHSGYWVPDEYIASFVSRAPEKLIGFASCDPTQPEAMDELRHAAQNLKLRGVKMGPTYAGFDPRDPRCDPIYAYCSNNGLPVLFHTGTTFHHSARLEFSRPWLFDEVSIRFPELRFVMAHAGHPFCEECMVVIRKHPHVYADISALYYRPWQFYNLLVAAQEYKVTHKLLFGTDYPFAGSNESIRGLQQVNQIVEGTALPRITSDTIDGILNRDACALLGLE